MKKSILLLLAFIVGFTGYSQQTGSFSTSIDFNGGTRTISVFVPNDYDENNSYQLMIGLHGMGDGGNNYKSALLNSLDFQDVFPNTILICPNGNLQENGMFYSSNNGEYIIDSALSYAQTHYNIDNNEIILQGFSLGAESALRFGLDYPGKFKGLILNTPAIQGVKIARNESNNYTFNYQNANQIPIIITRGDEDFLYEEPTNIAVAKLAENMGKVSYNIFSGGHVVPSFLNYPYLDFISTSYSNGLDASLYKLKIPYRACEGSIEAEILFQNTGNDVLEEINFIYGIGSNKDTFHWQGQLNLYESLTITLPSYDVSHLATNNYYFGVTIDQLNDSEDDLFTSFNHIEEYIHIMNEDITIPFSDNFSTSLSLSQWAFDYSGDYLYPLEYDEIDEAFFSFNSIFIFDNAGTSESIISPIFDFSNASPTADLNLYFDLEYNYVEYTAAMLGIDTILADTLEVLITTDCGLTYQSIFKEAGAALSAYDAPLLNPSNIESFFLYKDEDKIKTFSVDISDYIGQDNVAIKFKYISSLGGYIFLDKVEVNNYPISIHEQDDISSIVLYPNPAKDIIHINSSNEQIQEVEVYNMIGQLVHIIKPSDNKTINVEHWTKGQYIFKIKTNKTTTHKKALIN